MSVYVSRRQWRLRAAFAAGVVVLGLCALFNMAPPASAGTFCELTGLAPGSKCWGPATQGLDYAEVRTYQRAGCVAIANGSNVFVTDWHCGPATNGLIAASVWGPMSLTNYYKGVIWNNTGGNGNYQGGQNCVQGC